MTDNNNWPDPARPGVPVNPERDGWHWLEWMDYCGTKPTGMIDQFKWERDGYWDRTTHRSARYWACWRYIGPCLTPAEVDARVQQARRDALEEAAQVAKGYALKLEDMAELSPYPHVKREHEGRSWVAQTIAAAIRALKGEANE